MCRPGSAFALLLSVLNARRIFAVVVLCCSLACSPQSPDEQLLKTTDAAASWVPSLQMAAEKWNANSVPSRFMRSSAEAAQKEFDKAKKSAAKSAASQELRARITRDLDIADGIAAMLAQSAEHDDRRVVPAAVRSLVGIRSDFDSLEQQYGAKP